ncbi:hypothetical protein [Kaistella antarctica]|uniref:Uncharacterized protein n=1 Tax=Kaistella antarctica TaxID=266748 RepID=A0A3S4V4L2_9FLAO|nr:hypothetical protein [Kaistella antarctica]KEY20346.1 hypothetical protein HY04_03855 [Kaistella antarctica]SEV90740.1 hypothetical protein SAMN05421765_1000 [Kaistella antarctica]VEI01523.1 Uncharacterised protein [Kaistella antarctica]
MRRNNATDFFFGIILIVFTFFCVLAFLKAGLHMVMKFFGFQFNDDNTESIILSVFIILVVLLIIYFNRIKEYILLKKDLVFKRKYLEILLQNYKNELETKKANYQNIKNRIDEIDEIL